MDWLSDGYTSMVAQGFALLALKKKHVLINVLCTFHTVHVNIKSLLQCKIGFICSIHILFLTCVHTCHVWVFDM